MKSLFTYLPLGWLACLVPATPLTAQTMQRDYPIQPVPFTHVHLHDRFWAPRIGINANVTIPYVLAKCRETGRIDNFLKAARKMPPGKITDWKYSCPKIMQPVCMNGSCNNGIS